MGLHTWFYNKVNLNDLDLNEMTQNIVDELNTKINFLEGFENTLDEDDDINYTFTIEETLDRYKKILKFLISKNRKRKVDLIKLYEELFEDYLIYKNNLYIYLRNEKENYDDCFRALVKEKPLENLEDTFLFLSKGYGYGQYTFDENQENFKTNLIDIQKILNFWGKYKNGLIIFS